MIHFSNVTQWEKGLSEDKCYFRRLVVNVTLTLDKRLV